MADPNALYIVTAVVISGLVAWVVLVLITAPRLVPMTPLVPEDVAKKDALPARIQGPGPLLRIEAPAVFDAMHAMHAMPVIVKLPPMRSRLDSHTEIQDEADGEAASILMPEDDAPSGPPLVLVTAVGRADPFARKKHEDAFAIVDRHHLFVIADSMGRYTAGEVASQLAVDTIAGAFDSDGTSIYPDDPALPRRANRLRRAILVANRKILSRAREIQAYTGMGTTAVALYFSPNNQRAHIAYVGGSRCYRVRGSQIALLTRENDAGTSGAALGPDESVKVEIVNDLPLPGDAYLLCSLGLSSAVPEAEMLASILGAKTLEVATTVLVEKARAESGRDNITAILVRVDAPV